MSDSEYETDSGSEYEEVTDDEQEVAPVKSGQKASEPCKAYRVDTKAIKFGMCKCGWDKESHGGPRRNKAKEALQRLKSDGAVDTYGEGVCLNYRVDVTAEKFGTCKCGYPQGAHKSNGVNPARKALKSLKVVSRRSIERTKGKASAACGNYSVDPKATEFGLCYCGWSKLDHEKKEENHAAAALRKMKEKNKSANEAADMAAAGVVSLEDKKKKGKSNVSKTANGSSSGEQETPSNPLQCCVVM